MDLFGRLFLLNAVLFFRVLTAAVQTQGMLDIHSKEHVQAAAMELLSQQLGEVQPPPGQVLRQAVKNLYHRFL